MRFFSLAGALVLMTACDRGPAAPAPPPTDPNQLVTPTESSGQVRIGFVRASTPPGSTISGCGPLIAGCAGRLVISLLLSPPSDGPVLFVRVFLHSMRNGRACLIGEAAPFTVRAGQPVGLDVTLDQSDECGTPETIATMDAVVGGPVQIDSRQAWGIHYTFAP